jgi:four helix bundle protein
MGVIAPMSLPTLVTWTPTMVRGPPSGEPAVAMRTLYAGRKPPSAIFMTRASASVVDQLKRAALAIPFDIAEGAGRTGQGEAAHSYATARGEAMECAPALDVLQLLKAISEERHHRACDLLERLLAMLTKMCR